MLAMKYNFDGLFDCNCQAESVPASLVFLVNMILYGPNIETQASNSSKARVQQLLTIHFTGQEFLLFQRATSETPGAARERIVIEKTETNTKSVSALPELYTEIPPVDVKFDNVPNP